MSKITRRSYKRKKIIMGAALFGAVGLVSTGFAAWVLSASTTLEQNASLHVGTVSDKNMSFTNTVIYKTGDANKVADSNFHFEPDKEDTTGRVRAEKGENVPAPVLSLSVDTQLNQAQNLGTLTASIEYIDNDSGADPAAVDPNHTQWSTAVQSAVDKKYIVAPEAAENDITLYDYNNGVPSNPGNLVFSEDKVTATFTYVVAFQWGQFFSGLNPSIFFDDKDPAHKNSANKNGVDYTDEEVAAILVELHDLLDSAQLKLTLVANPN